MAILSARKSVNLGWGSRLGWGRGKGGGGADPITSPVAPIINPGGGGSGGGGSGGGFIDPFAWTREYQVSGPNDDAYEQGDGVFNYTNTYIYAYSRTIPTSSLYRCCGARFTLVDIHKNSTITQAWPIVYCRSSPEEFNFKIYGHLVANSPDFATNQHIISQAFRPRTTAYTEWVETFSSAGWKNIDGSHCKITAVIQELISQASWSLLNSLTLLFIANTNQVGQAHFASQEYSNHTYAMRLHVEGN